MAIRACLRCGSDDLRGVSLREGGVQGITGDQATCRECGSTGPALEFEDREAWQAFRKAQQR